jgi:hypothetical protein
MSRLPVIRWPLVLGGALGLLAGLFFVRWGPVPVGPAADRPAPPITNREAVIPPQCYTRTEGRHNPCYVCHQDQDGRDDPNAMNDGFLQGVYAFSDYGMTNRWQNLFRDRREAVAAISDAEIAAYVAQNNYTPLRRALAADPDWSGYTPDLANLHRGGAAFDAQGFAKDGSGWVAFNYKPFPSTFWPTNGSTDDVMVRLPAAFRQSACGDAAGRYSRDTYLANLAILEAAIKDRQRISLPPVDEAAFCQDLNGDGRLGTITELRRPEHYVGAAAETAVTPQLYPAGTEFLHSVRYVGVDAAGEVHPTPRLKELRYMRKIRFYDKAQLRSLYGNEHQEKRDGNLPTFTATGYGLDNGFGWLVLGFIEDEHGDLRKQSREEQLFCMGCHTTMGATIDQTFAFPRKVTGARGWGYLDLDGMRDAPHKGASEGEILQYLRRVGGGSEFRENEEMQRRWFDEEGNVRADKVRAADVAELITPSRERARRLNKAYRVIVQEQSFVHGRDATVEPATNVYETVPGDSAPLPAAKRYDYDIRLDWGR